MNFSGAAISVMVNKMYGYNFRMIENRNARDEFNVAMKAAIPMRMWDIGSRRWWVPDLYSPIIESIALQFGALLQSDMERIAGSRAKYESGPVTLDGDLALLGLMPGAPYRLIEMAYAYWKTALTPISISTLQLQAIEEAWVRIQAHYVSEAARPLLGPLGAPR